MTGASPDGGSAGESSEVGSLSKGVIFELLRNDRRRKMLYYLQENDGSASLTDLAKHIAATEEDVPVHALSTEQHKRVYVALYQTHVPKLTSAGVIDRDEEESVVALEEEASLLFPYLDLDPVSEAVDDGRDEAGVLDRFRSSILSSER